MGTILDYARTVTESFETRPFNEVDSLVLCELVYLRMDGLVPGRGEGFRPFEDLGTDQAVEQLVFQGRVPALDGPLVRAVANNPRYRELQVGEFVNDIRKEEESQFCGVTFLFPEFAYIAFRGTDTSYVAWKENFNMGFLDRVPSQEQGLEYVDRVGALLHCPLRLGGHSKGGNIAVYASLFCREEIRQRVGAVYSHDGPGLSRAVLDSPEYEQMKGRVLKTIPQSSFIGMLLDRGEPCRIIRSNQFWILQHDPFSWVVENGEFRSAEDLSSGARFLDNSFNYWLDNLTADQLSLFSDAVYRILRAFPGDDFNDLPDKWWQTVFETVNGLRGIDKGTYFNVLKALASMITLAFKSIPKSIPRPSWAAVAASLPEGFARQVPFLRRELEGPHSPRQEDDEGEEGEDHP